MASRISEIMKHHDNENIEETIKAFSLFLALYNKNYHYNEGYLNEFASKFINYSKSLFIKKKIILQVIKEIKMKYKNDLEICFDNIWTLNKDKLDVNEEISELNFNETIMLLKCSKNGIIDFFKIKIYPNNINVSASQVLKVVNKYLNKIENKND